jgi:hypothetical protein
MQSSTASSIPRLSRLYAPSAIHSVNVAALLQMRLCPTDGMFPFFPKMLPLDNPIDGIIAKVGMDGFDHRMDLLCRESAMFPKKVDYRPFEDGCDRFTSETQCNEFIFGLTEGFFKLSVQLPACALKQ